MRCRNGTSQEALAAEIEAAGGSCLPVACDVSDEQQVIDGVAKVVETYGKVDILVNNAGMIEYCPTVDLPLDKWQRVVDVSLTGYFLMARECAKQSMIPNKYGRIVNTASMFGHIASFHNPILVYNATKGAVPNFTRSLAQEWAEYNITVNAIGPGMFPSEMMVVDDATRDYLAARCPIGRPGVVDELCGQLLLFSSDACSYTTGPRARPSTSTVAGPASSRASQRCPHRPGVHAGSRPHCVAPQRPTQSRLCGMSRAVRPGGRFGRLRGRLCAKDLM